MNFKNAAYMAGEDGIQVDYVKVDDDIAVQDSLYTVGRRGVAGTVFVHKIAGAAALAGCNLEEVKAIAQRTASSVKSIGFAFTSCTVPAKGTPTFDIGEDERSMVSAYMENRESDGKNSRMRTQLPKEWSRSF